MRKEVGYLDNEETRDLKQIAEVFLLVNVVSGKEDTVARKLMRVPEIRKVHTVLGGYDLIAVMEVERGFIKPAADKVAEILKTKVRKIAGISHTETLIPISSKVK